MAGYIRPLVFILALLVFATAIATSDAAPMRFDPDPFDTALAQVGLDSSALGIDRADRGFYGGDKYRLHYFDVLSDDPLKAPVYVPMLRDRLTENEQTAASLQAECMNFIGKNIRVTLVEEPLKDLLPKCETETALYDALAFANTYLATPYILDYTYDPAAFTAEDCAAIPADLQYAAAVIIYGTFLAQEYHTTAFNSFYGDDRDNLFNEAVNYAAEDISPASEDSIPAEPDVNSEPGDTAAVAAKPLFDYYSYFVERALDQVDWGYLYAGGAQIAHAVDLAIVKLKGADPFQMAKPVVFDTPLGPVVFGSSRNDEYDNGTVFIRIDPGGNDTYRGGGATRDSLNWASVQIDLKGDDRYLPDEFTLPAQGAGVCGYGFQIDFAGDDTYEARALSQGAGLFGCGMLLDFCGNDKYNVIASGQAAGWFGTGVLADFGGSDTYDCYEFSQGFGYTLGGGLLLDATGDDVYTANDSDIRFPSAQSQEHNGSLAQGFGFGKRADYVDGHSMAGGVGALIDGGGDDSYTCGVFGQGCAYWYGIGILSDKSGDDEYLGQWYVQGSGAHFAVGILNDGGGNDVYTAPMQMAQGAGHDFSVGFLYEESGNDIYNAKRLCNGGGNANGTGIFWDVNGDDTYNCDGGACLGMPSAAKTGGLRDVMYTIGLFIDTGGKDSYSALFPFAGDNRSWRWSADSPDTATPFNIGCGLDGEMQVRTNELGETD
jgi:hypothetical protein